MNDASVRHVEQRQAGELFDYIDNFLNFICNLRYFLQIKHVFLNTERKLVMSDKRKRFIVEFILRQLSASAKREGKWPYSIVLSEQMNEGTLLWDCASLLIEKESAEVVENAPRAFGRQTSVLYGSRQDSPTGKLVTEIYSFTADVIWSLCLRGILRPGRGLPSSTSALVSSDNGYTLTEKGCRILLSDTNQLLEELVSNTH